jgi:hypothetical protein
MSPHLGKREFLEEATAILSICILIEKKYNLAIRGAFKDTKAI